MTRLYGRGFSDERIEEYVPDVRFERTSVISSISLNGIQAPLMFKGALNESIFTTYIRDVLAPTIEEGDIVFLDNLAVHKVSGALDPILLKGANVVFLPPYSHDFNPIELAWSKMKAVLRKLKPRWFDELVVAMKSALDSITISNIVAWFKHCGYDFNV
jgi:transposase